MNKNDITPNAQIVSALRGLWLRSRERSSRLKQDNYTCQKCGRKKSKEIKVEVHHLDQIHWDKIIKVVRKELLVPPKKLQTVCKDCHKKITKESK